MRTMGVSTSTTQSGLNGLSHNKYQAMCLPTAHYIRSILVAESDAEHATNRFNETVGFAAAQWEHSYAPIFR